MTLDPELEKVMNLAKQVGFGRGFWAGFLVGGVIVGGVVWLLT